MTIKRVSLSLAIFAFLVLVVVLAYYIGRFSNNPTNIAKVSTGQTAKTQPQKEISCTRTTRLSNAPQYDRALSLIAQRIDANNKYSDESTKFMYFPPKLTNCIKVIEANVTDTTGAEGYFTFNSKDIKQNYYPITIDASYYSTDDLLIALLLSHEMTHVQQYIDRLNGKNSLSCYDKEFYAFRAQLDFYSTLNIEEYSSVRDRIKKEDNLHPQLQILNIMLNLKVNSSSQCDKGLFSGLFNNCGQEQFLAALKNLIMQDETYKKQCSQ